MYQRIRAHLNGVSITFVLLYGMMAATDAWADGSRELEHTSVHGQVADGNFGKHVANLGDVNGNGFDDIAVAAPYVNNGAGAVYIYFGREDFFDAGLEPDLILHGQEDHDQFGISIAGDMDLNGDGFADIAIGARFSDLGASNAGAVFIYFGGKSLSSEPSLILTGEVADDWFGQSVSSAGDVNGDGYDDLIVGAPFNDDVGNAAGKAYIFFGGSNMNDQPDVELLGAATNHAHFGWSVSGACDVNGDGFDDVIVGARMHGTGPFQATGRAYIFHGGSPMNNTPDLIIDGEFPHDWFGESVSGAGDINGNGYDDVIVGAHFADPNGSASGKAYVFFGGPNMSATPGFTFAGPHADAQLGFSVSSAGDVNGNGFADVVVGAHFANNGADSAAGKAYVIFGNSNPVSDTADLEFSGTHADEHFGASVSGGGHVTGKAPASVLIGAPLNNEAAPAAGKASLYRFADEEPCPPADLNCDGAVNVSDLLILFDNWGDCSDCDNCPADLNGDCVVNVSDLLILFDNWG
jgi:hypothetical protein